MKFLYKIHSGYDGFSPRRIPERLDAQGRLALGWQKYIDAVDEDSEVWIYFHGPHAFQNGVYAKGVADEVEVPGRRVLLRLHTYSTDEPLTDPATSARVAEAVGVRYRQVFLLPEDLDEVPQCSLATGAASCRARQCGACPTWRALPRIDPSILYWPHRLPQDLDSYVPAYWVIPRRSFILMAGRRVKQAIRRTSQVFMQFKTGESWLAYPLALGIHEALADQDLGNFDAVVPIPLSPDKADAGEINRTRLLAAELARLRGLRVRNVLRLTSPISKRVLRTISGLNAPQFERRYREALDVDAAVARFERILLVDDVCTEGSTLRAAIQRIHEVNPDCEVVAVTAGQMIVRPVVADERPLLT